MLKNLGYDGTYRDQSISVSVLLENPLDYGLEPSTLVFSVTVKDSRKSAENLRFEDCAFYIMDERNCIYNTEKVLGAGSNGDAATDDDEPVRHPDGLILADFKHEFLFQDLRIAFYCKLDRQLHIIELRH